MCDDLGREKMKDDASAEKGAKSCADKKVFFSLFFVTFLSKTIFSKLPFFVVRYEKGPLTRRKVPLTVPCDLLLRVQKKTPYVSTGVSANFARPLKSAAFIDMRLYPLL